MPSEIPVVFEMQNTHPKDSDQSSVHSTSHYVNIRPLWWNSSGSHVSQSTHSKDVNMNMDPLAQHANQMKQLERQMPDQDSLSTQSTGQSHQEESGRDKTNFPDECVSSQSGYDASEKHIEDHLNSDLSLGSSDVIFTTPRPDYSQPLASASYPCADPYYMSFLATYGSHATMNPQMMGMSLSGRVPLPIEPAEEEPIYVNAKQFHRIMQRRQLRAKLEAQNKLIKDRKPYLHESRHLHALKRARGSGGRFLNTKQLEQQSQPTATTRPQDSLASNPRHLASSNGPSSTPTCSEVTTVSNNGGMFQQHHYRSFSKYGNREGGGDHITGKIPNTGFQL